MKRIWLLVILATIAAPARAAVFPEGAPPESVRIAELVDASYLPAAKLDPVLEKRGFARLTILDRSTETRIGGFSVARSTFLFTALATREAPGIPKGSLVLAIRGSHTANDWYTNVHMKMLDWRAGDHAGHGRIHEGFLAVARVPLESDPVMRAIRASPRIYLAGHSLGGAAAVIAAAHLLEQGVPADRLRVFTFGAPKPGDETFAAYYAARVEIHEFRNRQDPFFVLPPPKAYCHLCDIGQGQFIQVDDATAHSNPNDHHMWSYVYRMHGFDTDILSARFDIPAASIRLPFTTTQRVLSAGSTLASSLCTTIRGFAKHQNRPPDPPTPPRHSTP